MLYKKLWVRLHLLSNYGYERFALEVTKVSYLPRESSQETEENDDSKLENILHGVHLVVFIGVFVHQLSRAVGQELVLLDDDVPHWPHGSEITQLHQGEIRTEDQDVVQLHVKVTQLLRVDELQG